MTQQPAPAPRFAVILRIHFWDDFATRQLARLRDAATGADLFILVDETHGPVPDIPHDRVLRITETTLLAMGLPRAGVGGMLWFNGDYPLYRFAALFPEYDLILQLEYDAVLNLPAVSLLREVFRRQLDFVALTKGDPPASWFWRQSCEDAYPGGAFRHQLICVCILSRAALAHLHARRLAHAARLRDGKMRAWPMCEAFLPTELANAGFATAELSDFADTAAYDHWPPFLESDLPHLPRHAVIHPVLDPSRYVASMHKYRVGLAGYAWPFSRFHRKLRRLPPRAYLRAVATGFTARAASRLRRAWSRRAA